MTVKRAGFCRRRDLVCPGSKAGSRALASVLQAVCGRQASAGTVAPGASVLLLRPAVERCEKGSLQSSKACSVPIQEKFLFRVAGSQFCDERQAPREGVPVAQ